MKSAPTAAALLLAATAAPAAGTDAGGAPGAPAAMAAPAPPTTSATASPAAALPAPGTASGDAAALSRRVLALWDYSRPDVTEQRLRDALAQAAGDEALVLRAQVARTYGLRGRFDDAHRELDAIDAAVAQAAPVAQVHALLERGRTWRSAGQPLVARPLFLRAVDLALAGGLDSLAGDAMHMVALVEPRLEDQIAWAQRTVAHAQAATEPGARRWAAVALNNLGVALNEAGRHDEALAALQRALDERRAQAAPASTQRVARWMVAHTQRLLGRLPEALAVQQALEREFDAAGEPDPYVYEELALLHAALGQAAEADRYRALQARHAGR